MDNWLFRLTKPNKPNQTQFWANIKGVKAKTNPIQTQFVERPKMLDSTLGVCLIACLPGVGGFCVDKEHYDDINNATRGIYHPKWCKFQKILLDLTIN
jgi:hypothetical protein